MRIIHQTWKHRLDSAGDFAGTPFSPSWQNSWKEKNPGWEYKLWTDFDLRAFIRDNFRKFLDIYDDYPSEIHRVDAARYFILKKLGGVFVDLDIACLKPMDRLIGHGETPMFGKQWHGVLENGIACNAWMYSPPGNPFWGFLTPALRERFGPEVLGATGPNWLTDYMQLRDPHLYRLLEPEFIHPVKWDDPVKRDLLDMSLDHIRGRWPEAYCISHWAGSWK